MRHDRTAAFIGLGGMGREHLELLGRLGRVKIAAVHDADPEVTREVAGRFGATAFDSWEEMLDRAKPELVWICTPPLAHRDPTVAALERGIHVYLEKPIARTVADGAAIAAAAAESTAVCAVGYQWHALDIVDAARRELAGVPPAFALSVGIGHVRMRRQWFLKRAESGGNLLERGSHQVELLLALAGDVAAVQAVAGSLPLAQTPAAGSGDIDVEDAVAVLLELASGGTATLVCVAVKDDQPVRYTLDLLTPACSLRINLDPEFTLEGTSAGRDLAASSPPLEASVSGFLEAVEHGDRSLVACSPAVAARTLEVVVACEEALATGRRVSV